MLIRVFGICVLAMLVLALSGCMSPGGGLFAATAGTASPLTYPSTAESPKTIAIVDIRTGETVFERAVPIGKQLSLQFSATKYQQGDKDRPDTMKYAIQSLGTTFGRLGSSVAVPPAWARRIDLFFRSPDPYTTMNVNRPVDPMPLTTTASAMPASQPVMPALHVPPAPVATVTDTPETNTVTDTSETNTVTDTSETNTVTDTSETKDSPTADQDEVQPLPVPTPAPTQPAAVVSPLPRSSMTWTDTGVPRRITVSNTSSGDTVFEVDVPAQSDLVLQFYDMWRPADSDQNVQGMHWQIVPAGSVIQTPSHHATVPAEAYRQIREVPLAATAVPAAPKPTQTPQKASPDPTPETKTDSPTPPPANPPIDLLEADNPDSEPDQSAKPTATDKPIPPG